MYFRAVPFHSLNAADTGKGMRLMRILTYFSGTACVAPVYLSDDAEIKQ